MPAPILPSPPDRPDPTVIERAGRTLRDGGLVAIPTETVYGLAANALDATAIDAIYAAKGRPSTDPLIVHVDGLEMAARVVAGPLPAPAATLADAFWPGPLTLVLPRHEIVPPVVSSGLATDWKLSLTATPIVFSPKSSPASARPGGTAPAKAAMSGRIIRDRPAGARG